MHVITKLPDYFYSATHPARWVDPYASPDGSERLVLTPAEIGDKVRRQDAYLKWLGRFGLKGKQPRWQAIRVISFKHEHSNSKDWWERYQDAVFRVFVQPETTYDGKHYKQWYVLCPEDCYLVNRYELERKGPTLPPRDPIAERYISTDKRLRKVKLIPCRNCHHLRHETTGGRLPEGL